MDTARELSSLAPGADWDEADPRAHIVQFYELDRFLIDAADRFIGAALESGSAAVVIASKTHRAALAERLSGRGLDVSALGAENRYVALDAAETLAQILVDGWPDEARFAGVVGGAIARAAALHQRVRAFGEMVALLYADGKHAAALRLEELWNGLSKRHPFSLLCAYPMNVFGARDEDDRLLRICEEHSHVVPAESYSALTGAQERLRAIARLQLKAEALEAETAERVDAERSLRRHQEELADFFDNAAIGLHWVGADGIIQRANRAELRLLGYPAEEYVGRPVAEFHVDRTAIDDILAQLRAGETVQDYEARLRCRDGSIKHVLIDSNVLWEDGKFVHTRCFTRDITDRKKAEAERERLLAAAERARLAAEAGSRAKDEFLAMLGHELRNPLSAVRNAVLTARLDIERRDRALEIAHRQTERLGGIVDDLLDVARITQGRIVLRKEHVLLRDVVRNTVDGVRSLIEDRGQILSVALPEEPLSLEADAARLEQAILNLLTNAAKYSPPGSSIALAVERAGDQVVLRVRDNGIGIAPEMLPRVFDLFAQGDRSLDRVQGGLGIGLTIVKRLVELHGGSVEARSAGLGRGAEFAIRLPAIACAEAADAASARDRLSAPRRVRVLIVEDNEDAAESLRMLLELLGHQVRVAHDGLSALETAVANPPDVMLVDIGLPGIDGYEVAQRARRDSRLGETTLVALTGYGSEEDKREAVAAGFDHHLVKPIDPDALQDLIGRLARPSGAAAPPPSVH